MSCACQLINKRRWWWWWRPGMPASGRQRSLKYAGARPWMHFHTSTAILKSIRSLIRSQWSSLKTEVMCSRRGVPLTRRAAAFWTDCRRCRWTSATPASNIFTKFRRGHPLWGAKYRWGIKISRFCTNKSLYLANDTRYRHSYYGRRIGTRMRAIKWCHFQWHWTNPNPVFHVTPLFDAKYHKRLQIRPTIESE